MIIKRVLTVAATVLVATGVVAGTPAAANAGAYGCSGQVVRSDKLENGLEMPISVVYLYYDSRTGYNCAVNVWLPGVTDKSRISVGIRSKSSGWRKDSGNFKRYAGPVKVYGRNRCVKVTASSAASFYQPHATSGWIACR
ncbi:hypothetical protein AB0L53_58805 [Nonomuraea sp. NPDC052129]|uniref:hypothetical protein n=1 Tax=Nonomuraea sp. NPDC052129 TaxID=3154651 RepID=UPI003419592E